MSRALLPQVFLALSVSVACTNTVAETTTGGTTATAGSSSSTGSTGATASTSAGATSNSTTGTVAGTTGGGAGNTTGTGAGTTSGAGSTTTTGGMTCTPACTMGDTCIEGFCVPGGCMPACTMGKTCIAGNCVAATCNPACTTGQTCVAGTCVGAGTPCAADGGIAGDICLAAGLACSADAGCQAPGPGQTCEAATGCAAGAVCTGIGMIGTGTCQATCASSSNCASLVEACQPIDAGLSICSVDLCGLDGGVLGACTDGTSAGTCLPVTPGGKNATEEGVCDIGGSDTLGLTCSGLRDAGAAAQCPTGSVCAIDDTTQNSACLSACAIAVGDAGIPAGPTCTGTNLCLLASDLPGGLDLGIGAGGRDGDARVDFGLCVESCTAGATMCPTGMTCQAITGGAISVCAP